MADGGRRRRGISRTIDGGLPTMSESPRHALRFPPPGTPVSPPLPRLPHRRPAGSQGERRRPFQEEGATLHPPDQGRPPPPRGTFPVLPMERRKPRPDLRRRAGGARQQAVRANFAVEGVAVEEAHPPAADGKAPGTARAFMGWISWIPRGREEQGDPQHAGRSAPGVIPAIRPGPLSWPDSHRRVCCVTRGFPQPPRRDDAQRGAPSRRGTDCSGW